MATKDKSFTIGTRVEILHEFHCPFCAQAVSVGKAQVSEDLIVIHDTPSCASFREMAAHEFIQKSRQLLFKQAN